MLLRIVFIVLVMLPIPHLTHAQEETPDFQLIILETDWLQLALGYDAENAFKQLQAADLLHPLYVLELDDLASYQWDWQMLTLHEDATQRLVEAVVNIDRQADVQKLINLKASQGMGNPLERELYIQPFVVLVDGEFLYGGIFLDAMSQMAVSFPVIRVEFDEGQAIFNILPTHIPFVNYDPVPREDQSLDAAFTSIIDSDREQIPTFFQNAVTGWSNSEASIYFRELIRDERLHQIVVDADHLLP